MKTNFNILIEKLYNISFAKNELKNVISLKTGTVLSDTVPFKDYSDYINNLSKGIAQQKTLDLGYKYINELNNEVKLFCNDARINNLSNFLSGFYDIVCEPICPNSIIDMSHAYFGCTNLTGSPVCGPNVTNMNYTYYNCVNLTGNPVCGSNVTNMNYTYYECTNLTGSPVCGPNVTNMNYTYYNCVNLTGSPACGNNVLDMEYAYYNCRNLTGEPIFGDKVTNVYYAYWNCTNLTGNALFFDIPSYYTSEKKLFDYHAVYYNCSNLTGLQIVNNITQSKNLDSFLDYCENYSGRGFLEIPDSITSMAGTYRWTQIIGPVICGEEVTNMQSFAYHCTNLTYFPVCGDKVTNMYGAYFGCTNLIGSPVCGPNVTDMSNAYENCTNLTGDAVFPFGDTRYSTYFGGVYYNCSNLSGIICPDSWTSMSGFAYNALWYHGKPGCGNNVVYFPSAYYNCANLTGEPVCGDNVIVMSGAYMGCLNIYGNPAAGKNVRIMSSAYYNCKNLYGNLKLYYNSSSTNNYDDVSLGSCFFGRNNQNLLNIYVHKNSSFNNWLYNVGTLYDSETPLEWTLIDNGYFNAFYNTYVYYNL